MERDSSPLLLPNTFRDSNEIPPQPRQTFVLPSTSNNENMVLHSESRHSIVRPMESDSSLSSNGLRPINRPLGRSIVRPNDNDNDERSIEEQSQQPEPIFNGSLVNHNNNYHPPLVLQATGFDRAHSDELDADEAFALQLQEEEYSRESSMPNRHRFLPFRVDPDEELESASGPVVLDDEIPPFNNDEEFAAYLQQRENQTRERYRRPPPPPFFPVRQRPDPSSAQPTAIDEANNPSISPFAFPQQQRRWGNEDEDDDETPNMQHARAFFELLAHRGHAAPEGFPLFFPGFRRGHRRAGNLQDTEDDFGPEDYERLLQLDDTIQKKKLTKEQINTVPLERFKRLVLNNDEENKCGVCLEFFEDNQSIRRFPCRHVYHKECADRWLQEMNVCPICREPPIKVPQTVNSRSHRTNGGSRRPAATFRTNSNRNNNSNANNNNTHHHYHRRGRAPDSQS